MFVGKAVDMFVEMRIFRRGGSGGFKYIGGKHHGEWIMQGKGKTWNCFIDDTLQCRQGGLRWWALR
jgi:hypothetical protein